MIVTQRRIQSTAPDLAVLLGGSQGDIQNHGMRPMEVPLGGAPLLLPLPAAVSLGPFPRLRGKVRMGASAAQRQQLMQYHFEHSRSFFEYLIVPESHNSISLDVDTRVAAGVARGPAPDADHHQAQSPALRPGTRNPPHTHRPEPAGESGNRSIAGAANAATAVARRQWIDCAVCGHELVSVYRAIAALCSASSVHWSPAAPWIATQLCSLPCPYPGLPPQAGEGVNDVGWPGANHHQP